MNMQSQERTELRFESTGSELVHLPSIRASFASDAALLALKFCAVKICAAISRCSCPLLFTVPEMMLIFHVPKC